MPWLTIGASVGSSVLSSIGSSRAKRRQQEAADAAIRLKGTKYEEGKQLQQPWYNAGSDALSQLQQRLPDLTAGYDPSKLLNEPGYQFGLTEGQRTLEQSLAASGMTNSGAALKRAARYGTDYATTKLGEAFDRDRLTRLDGFEALRGLAGMGQRTAENLSREGNSYAESVAGDVMGKANAGAANDIAQGNIWGNLLNAGASAAGGMKMPGAGDMGINTGSLTDEQRRLRYLADGGPVRAEPKVGTRGPQRQGGGGGGLSREAVLAALDAARTPTLPAPMQPQQRGGLIPRVEVAVDRAARPGFADGGRVSLDPTEGQSFGDNVLQGIGQGMATLIRTVGGRRAAEAMGLPGTAEEAALLDAALLRTSGGNLGSAVGQSLPAVVAAPFVPLPAAAALALAPSMVNTLGDRGADQARRVRDYASGGPVRGDGAGKADTVPARLSGGEHVIDAEVVAMLGDGNTEAGHALLEDLKRRVREFKRQAPAGRPAPALE